MPFEKSLDDFAGFAQMILLWRIPANWLNLIILFLGTRINLLTEWIAFEVVLLCLFGLFLWVEIVMPRLECAATSRLTGT